jgi:hypothetical protein
VYRNYTFIALPSTPALRAALVHAATIAVITGCSSDGTRESSVAGPWTSARDQRGDTTIVRTVSGSVWGDTMVLVPEMSVGERDGAPATIFGRVTALDVDSNGRIYIVDGSVREVRIFAATGEHVRTFGHAGDGPGEFRLPNHLRVASDGRIVIRDGLRFLLFSAEGRQLGGWPIRSGYSTNAPFFLDQNNRVINPTFSDRLVAYDLDGTARDTMPEPTLGHVAPRLNFSFVGGRGSYAVPFMPGESWTMLPDGRVLIGLSDRYAIHRWGPGGRVLRVEHEVTLVPVEPGESEQARQATTRAIRSGNVPDWTWNGPDIPVTKPLFRLIAAGVDGTIWVFRDGPSVHEQNPNWDPQRPDAGFPTVWRSNVVADVFDEEGRYLGPIPFPRSVTWSNPPAILSRDRIWAVTEHESGHPQVVRYRVEHK